MIKIEISSHYEDVKGKSEKLIYICLWGWYNIGWRKGYYEMARKSNFKYLGETNHKNPDGSIFKLPSWWDEVGRKIVFFELPNPIIFNLIYLENEDYWDEALRRIFDLKLPRYLSTLIKSENVNAPQRYINEKKFFQEYKLKKRTFYQAWSNLKKQGFVRDYIKRKDEKVPIKKSLQRKIEKHRRNIEKKDETKAFVENELFEYLYTKFIPPIFFEKNKDEYEYYQYIYCPRRGDFARYFQFIKPQNKMIQIPYSILIRKDLSIAERLVGIELYRLKKEEKLNMRRKNNRSYMYFGKDRITEVDLAKKIGFSKPIIIDTLKKLWH